MRKLIALAAAVMLGTFSPAPSLAQAAPVPGEAVQADAHELLYEAMCGGIDQDQMIEGQLRSVREVWEADANLLVAERQFPGLMDAMIDAARPIIRKISEQSHAEYRPKMIAAMKTVLNAEEAADAAEFYNSPIGRKLLGGIAANADARRTIEGYLDNQEVAESDIRGDIRATSGKAVGALTDEELAALGEMATEKPALMKLGELGEAIIPIRMEMERAAMTGELQTQMAAAVEAAAKQHIGGK